MREGPRRSGSGKRSEAAAGGGNGGERARIVERFVATSIVSHNADVRIARRDFFCPMDAPSMKRSGGCA